MHTGTFRYQIGEFECAWISDGALNYPPESLFANAPLERVEEALRKHDLPVDQVATPYTCLFVNTGEHRVLVDTGAGDLGAHADKVFPGLDHSTSQTGLLPENLRAAGLESSDIDTVVITHAHPDHVGGALDEKGVLIFSDARFFVSREEWDFWHSDDTAARTPALMVGTAHQKLEALEGRLTLVENGSEIFL
jgi:glyoxylase-like metal-dependent hydrolase (beta-lactamase superfamily II)